MLSTHQEVATQFGVSLVTVSNWLRRPDFPGGRQGPWDPDQVEPYLKANGLGRHHGSEPTGEDDKDESLTIQKLRAEIRKLKADGDGKEFRNLKAQESVIDRREAMQAVSELLLMIGTRLDQIPDDIEMSIPSEVRLQVKQDVTHTIRLIRKEMAAWRM